MQIIIKTKHKQEPLGDLYGLFFEDISHAADGGLYAELVQNRSFEFSPIDNNSYHSLTAWEKVEEGGKVELSVQEGDAVSPKNPHFLVMNVTQRGSAGVQNLGFNCGIPLRKKEKYLFSCYARGQGGVGTITVSLRSKTGQIYQEKRFPLTEDWVKYETEFTAPEEDFEARLAIMAAELGQVHLDFVSLFPKDTYKGRRNGLRRDLAEALEAMHPKFLRFPGGCLVHDGSLDPDARDSQYRWKNSIGPLEERPARRNNWGYNQTLGLGYFEYFQFCEDIGAKPLPVLPGGVDPHHHREAEGAQLEAFIQDALDLIQFANGTPDTPWGAKRAAMGHPAPFGLEYLGIGNEETGEAFFERLPLFVKAIREIYPEIKLVGTSGPFCAGPEYDRGWDSARQEKLDLVDEHYYQSPEWFVAHHHRYDGFPEGPKVFLGEYASKDNTWFNALAEASYMVGLERNARAVGMACYAPMLCNEEYCSWRPNMIWFDNHQLMRTPNYYVQKLFMEHQGTALLKQELAGTGKKIRLCGGSDALIGGVALSGHESTVEFWDVVLTNTDTGERRSFQGPIRCEGSGRLPLCGLDWENYTIQLKARELSGWKGFYLWFGVQDEQNRLCWQLGGWNNGDSLIEEWIDGRDSALIQKDFHVEKGRVYDLELRVHGRKITALLDGRVDLETEALPALAEPLYAVSSLAEASGDVIVKLVNLLPTPQTADIVLEGRGALEGTAYIMGGYGREARNVLGQRETVVPRAEQVRFDGNNFQWIMGPESVCVLRLH